MNFKEKLSPSTQKKLSDLLFILYAGGAALLSYSLVYALRKPFTAATFDGMELFGMDYKIATSIIQIFGYMVSKFIGIKLISETEERRPPEIHSCLHFGCRGSLWFFSDACPVRSMYWHCSSTVCLWDACGESSSVSSKEDG